MIENPAPGGSAAGEIYEFQRFFLISSLFHRTARIAAVLPVDFRRLVANLGVNLLFSARHYIGNDCDIRECWSHHCSVVV